jgi:hypothetical protein
MFDKVLSWFGVKPIGCEFGFDMRYYSHVDVYSAGGEYLFHACAVAARIIRRALPQWHKGSDLLNVMFTLTPSVRKPVTVEGAYIYWDSKRDRWCLTDGYDETLILKSQAKALGLPKCAPLLNKVYLIEGLDMETAEAE